VSDRHKCTPNDPWTAEKASHGYHPDAVTTYEGWESTTYQCPNCNERWKVYDEDTQ
jgi:hypothetical protein